jgi:hypothetical protein
MDFKKVRTATLVGWLVRETKKEKVCTFTQKKYISESAVTPYSPVFPSPTYLPLCHHTPVPGGQAPSRGESATKTRQRPDRSSVPPLAVWRAQEEAVATLGVVATGELVALRVSAAIGRSMQESAADPNGVCCPTVGTTDRRPGFRANERFAQGCKYVYCETEHQRRECH